VRHVAVTVIAWCWIAWLALWIVMAFSTKRTVERSSKWWVSGLTVVVVVVVVVVAVLLRVLGGTGTLERAAWTPSPAVSVLSVALVVTGLAFTAWARLTLGRNWSGAVVFKEDQKLIVAGPYAVVRHPIYTGLLAMLLGTALAYAEPIGFFLFAAGVVALYAKARKEEQLMTRHFPGAYAAYRERVKAIIPYVL
jgi:protein-S-isoprenylcysteine O-methyltransferase Ste14